MEQKGWIAVFYLPPVTMWKRLSLLISLVGRCSSIKSCWRLPVRLALLELHCSYQEALGAKEAICNLLERFGSVRAYKVREVKKPPAEQTEQLSFTAKKT